MIDHTHKMIELIAIMFLMVSVAGVLGYLMYLGIEKLFSKLIGSGK